MQNIRASQILNFKYEKSSADIITAAGKKIVQISAKIKEREARIVKAREEYGITDAVLIDLLAQARNQVASNLANMTYQYTSSKQRDDGTVVQDQAVIGAGIISMLMTERDAIAAEKDQVSKLKLVARNLEDLRDEHNIVRGHELTSEELVYLGF